MSRLWPSRRLGHLVERLMAPEDRHALGDLDEEFRRIVRARSRLRAELWYAREALGLAVAGLGSRFARRGPASGGECGGAVEPGRTGGGAMSGWTRDASHALRALVREPGTTAVITLTLAASVGATTAIFGVANAAFLRPLPYPDADRMVRVFTGVRDDPTAAFAVSPLDWRDFDGLEGVVEEAAAWGVGESVHLTSGPEPLRLEAPRASADLFDLLGAEPVVGRFFTPEEEVPGADAVVVLSHGLWTRAFGADPEVVGRSVELDGRSHRIVGVAPRGGVEPRNADLWRVLALGPEWWEEGRWGWQFLETIARLEPGVDVPSATRALNERLAAVNPDRAGRLGQTRVVRSVYEERAGESGRAVLLLLGAVGLLLAMACANVMNVMRARSDARLREYALRRALGSGGGSLARLVLLETLALAAAGTLAGLALAALGLRLVESADIGALEALGPLGVDGRVLGFGALLTVGTAALFGAAPLLDALRADPHRVLTETSTRGRGGGRAGARLRDGLVIAQVTLALTLLVAVGLTASGFRALVTRDPGFDPAGVLAVTLELPRVGDGSVDGAQLHRSLLERLSAVPGVSSAGAVNFLPLEGVGWSASIDLVDPDPAVTDPDPGGNMRPVGVGYFATMGIPVVEGRSFSEADGPDVAPVAIVDEAMARRYWPGGSAVGSRAVVGAISREPATIVGVVGNVPDESLDRSGSGHVYFPVTQSPQRRMTFVLRSARDPLGLVPSVRAAIRDVDDRIPVTEASTVEARLGRSLAGFRLSLLLLSGFGAAAALLAALGIYGVLSYSVSRRAGEIGVRMALGAAPRAIVRAVLTRVLRLWLVGSVLGIATSVGVATALTRLQPGLEPAGWLPYLLAFGLLAVVALVGATLPALRAVSVDPASSLRVE